MMIGPNSSSVDEILQLLEGSSRPLRRAEVNGLAGPLARALHLDAAGMISLMFALQGDFRHAVQLAERILPRGETWTIDPDPRVGRRGGPCVVRIGEAAAKGSVPALVLAAALLRASLGA
jgi:hypothetical protein